MWFSGKLRRNRRGAGSIIGAVFLVLILLSGFMFYNLNVNVARDYTNVLQDMQQLDLQRNKEKIEFVSVSTTSEDRLNMTLKNTGSYQAHLIWLGIFDNTVTPNVQRYYELDVYIKPSEIVTNIPELDITILEGQERVIHLVTDLGNAFSYIYPLSEESAEGGTQTSVTITGINGTATYYASRWDTLGSTGHVSGSALDLASNDGNYVVFRSYSSGTRTDITDFVDETVDLYLPSAKGAHSDFTAEQDGPDSIYDILTEENTGGSYTELWSDTFKPTVAATWQTVSLDSYGVPANSVAIIHIYQDEEANVKRDAGVRAVGSSLNRYIPMHEAEAGGLVVASMMVQVDANKNIQIYAETIAANTISFRVIGYFTGVTYTEKFEQWNPNYGGVWTDKDLYTDYGVPKGSVAEIFVANADPNNEKYVGVRTDGSSLNRYILIHESEGGGQDGFTMCVKTNAETGKIECYNTDTTGYFYLLGYFNSNIDYVERMDTLDATNADIWEDETLLTPANAVAEVLVQNDADNAARYGGVRANSSPLDRQVLIHEAEAGGLTGGRWSVQSDASSTIEIYEDRTQDNTFALVGYWIVAKYELDLEVRWTSVDYDEANEKICIYAGIMGSENLRVDVWNGSAWTNIMTNLSTGWNNVSVSSYLSSSTFIIRFKDTSDTGDAIQDSWEIDAVLLHVWTTTDEYTAEVVFEGSSNLEDWTEVDWQIDSCWDIGEVTVTIQFYNYTLGDYTSSGNGYISYVSEATPNTDELKSKTITLNPTDLRNGSSTRGDWKVKIKGVKSTGTQFLMKIDWIEFNLTYTSSGSSIPHGAWQRYTIRAFTGEGYPVPYAYVSIYANGTSVALRNAQTKESVSNPAWVRLDADGEYHLEIRSTNSSEETFVLYVVLGSVIGQKTITQEAPA